jgi:hypothetical protein
MVKTAPKTSGAGAIKKEASVKDPTKDKAVVAAASEPKVQGGKGNSVTAQAAGKTSKEPTKEKSSKPAASASAKGTEAEAGEDESALKSEVQGFLDGFNYDTDSDISEPEGLDEIDD